MPHNEAASARTVAEATGAGWLRTCSQRDAPHGALPERVSFWRQEIVTGVAPMNLTPNVSLKSGAVAFAIFWTGAMLWWTGSTGPVEICILAVCGALGSYAWYHAMRFAFRRIGLSASRGAVTVEARQGKSRQWMGWAGGMMVAGILAALLLDLVNPFIPAGDSQTFIKQMFVVLVWPVLMW